MLATGSGSVGHSRESLGLGTPGDSEVGRSRRLLKRSEVGQFRESLSWALQRVSWALQGVSGLGVSTSGRLWALQDSLEDSWSLWVAHFMQTLGLGTPGRPWSWAVFGLLGLGTSGSWALQGLGTQGVSEVGHSLGEEKSSGRGEGLSLKSNGPPPKVEKNANNWKNAKIQKKTRIFRNYSKHSTTHIQTKLKTSK